MDPLQPAPIDEIINKVLGAPDGLVQGLAQFSWNSDKVRSASRRQQQPPGARPAAENAYLLVQ